MTRALGLALLVCACVQPEPAPRPKAKADAEPGAARPGEDGGVAARPAAQQRIAVVDLQRALLESREGALATARLKKQFDESQRKLDEEQARLKRRIELGGGRADKDELAKKMTELQARYLQLQQELNQSETRETAALSKRMMTVVARLGEEKGFDLVLDRQAVPYLKPELDLTDELIRRVDAAGPADAGAP